MTDTYALLDRLPTPQEHRELAEAVGWGHAFAWATMAASLRGSLAGVVALDGGRVIGMGRLVGDGVTYFYVQDVAVLPSHQGRGIGRALLQRLLDHIARTARRRHSSGCYPPMPRSPSTGERASPRAT
jgi:ribosomal protein S18 acetylase RimI-like enzyme